MKFTKIRRLVSFGMHDNISLEAEIGEGETVDSVDLAVRQKIKQLVDDDSERREMLYETDSLSRQKKELERDIKTLKGYIDKNREALEKVGFESPELDIDIPF